MSLVTRLIAGLLMVLALSLPAAAQTATETGASDAGGRSFLEACASKIEERGRLRFCDTYFKEQLGAEADALLYLRDRITGLRASHEASAAEKYDSFLSAIYIVAFLTICSIVLVGSERRIAGLAKWATLTTTAALLVMIVVVAVGWLGKYRAEYAAQIELSILRDRIEAESAQAMTSGEKITPKMVRAWTADLQAIGVRFAENYGEASPMPELDRFHQN